jgi:hypothetical protein
MHQKINLHKTDMRKFSMISSRKTIQGRVCQNGPNQRWHFEPFGPYPDCTFEKFTPQEQNYPMKDYTVPIAVQGNIQDRINAFLSGTAYKYYSDARGKFIYLCRMMPDRTFQRLGRLTL